MLIVSGMNGWMEVFVLFCFCLIRVEGLSELDENGKWKWEYRVELGFGIYIFIYLYNRDVLLFSFSKREVG